MSMSRRQYALLNVAKDRLALSEAEYRSALTEIAGVTSATELDRESFDALMGYFEWRGFVPEQARGPDYGELPGMASFAQLELIRSLWR